MLDGLDGGTNVRTHQLGRDPVDHRDFLDGGVVDKQVDVRFGQVNPRGTRAKDEHFGLGVDLLHHSFDPVHDFLSFLFLSLSLTQKLDKVKNLTVEVKEDVLNFESVFAQPRIPAFVKFLCNSLLELTARVVIRLLLCLAGATTLRGKESVFSCHIEAQEVLIEKSTARRLLPLILPEG